MRQRRGLQIGMILLLTTAGCAIRPTVSPPVVTAALYVDTPSTLPVDRGAHVAAERERQARELFERGDSQGDLAASEGAVSAWRDVLALHPRDKVPAKWANTQNNLGLALTSLAQKTGSVDRFDEAIAAHRAVLAAVTRARHPNEWARAQSLLGLALTNRAGLSGSTHGLDEAVTAFRAALTVHRRETAPMAWAIIQINYADALTALANDSFRVWLIGDAIGAYRSALLVLKRETNPGDWARAQNNLAGALMIDGMVRVSRDRDEAKGRLQEALAAFNAALEVRTRASSPFQWAMTRNNMAHALKFLAALDGDASKLAEAVRAFDDAIAVAEEYKNEPFARLARANRAEAQVAFARGSAQADAEFQPPRRVTCQTDQALMGISGSRVVRDVSQDRYFLAGYSVQPPSGLDWCEVLDPRDAAISGQTGATPLRIFFAKNMYGNDVLTTAPSREQRFHTLLAVAFVGERPTRSGAWDLSSLRVALSDCGKDCVVVAHTETPLKRFGAQCLSYVRTLRMGASLLADVGYACIHPRNPRMQVTVVVSERWLEGNPFYKTLLTGRLASEYRTFLESLTFNDAFPAPRP